MMISIKLQRGATLLVTLIILILMTLMLISAFKLNKGNSQIVGNMQQRNQVQVAAQNQVENIISNIDFTKAAGVKATTSASINGSGNNDITIESTPTCLSIIPIPASALDPTNDDDIGCMQGNAQSFGITGTTNAISSLCSDALWDINAIATDNMSKAQVSVNQGTAVRVVSTTTCP
jgi:hypothetical protein